MIESEAVINEIYKMTSTEPFLKHVWKSKIRDLVEKKTYVITYCAEVPPEITSFILFYEWKRKPVVVFKYLGTKPEWRKKGIMSNLFLFLEAEFHDKIKRVPIRSDNQPMREFLSKRGYTLVKGETYHIYEKGKEW